MKSEKLSTEIAALQRKQKETKNAVAKKALSSKIERLKKELDEITTSAQAKTALAKAQSKIREMSQKDFGEFVKKLATKPEFSFLKGMSKSKIKDDIMRVAKPVGWRFRGRTNVKKPTKKDIQEGNNVYYEGRVNRSDVSRTVRLAEGGGVKYPTDLKVGTVLEGVGFPMLKGIDGGNYYTIVEMDNYSATLTKSDKNGNKKGSKKVRHYLSSIEGAIKTASRGDENGILVVKYAEGGGVGEEMARGGFVSKGEMVWGKISNSKKAEFLYENFTPEITPRSQEILVGRAWNFLPKNVKIKFESKYANVEQYAKGGGVGKSEEEVWNNWSVEQRKHFLKDHRIFTNKEQDHRASLYRFDELPTDLVNAIKSILKEHISEVQYAQGGKTDFGMLSVKAGIDNNPNPTYADKIAGAKMNKMATGGKIGDALYKEITSGIELDDWWEGHDMNTNVQVFNKDGDIYFLRSKGFYEEGKDYKLSKLTKEEAIEFGWLDKYANGGGVDRFSDFDLNKEGNFEAIIDGKKYEIIYRDDVSQMYDLFEDGKLINSSKSVRDVMKFSNGGGVGKVKVIKDQRGNTLYLTKIDSTHFFLSVNEGSKGNPYHIGQIKNEPYYNEVNEWLMSKYATGGGVGLVNYGDYSPTVSYKIPDEELSNFIDYVYDVYKEQGYTKMQVKNAVNRYLSDLDKQYTWGYGDSLDRERVYEYLLNPKLKGIQNPSLAKGGDVQSPEPHRLHMMAKGGMTFSESVLKEGLSDMLHHLYKAQNELDGIMGYLDRTGQGGMKSALKSKFGLNSISETTEKIDTYLDK